MKEASMCQRLVVAAVMMVVGVGCPHDWMKGGTNDRAMRKDAKESIRQPECPDGLELVEDCENRDEAGACTYTCE